MVEWGLSRRKHATTSVTGMTTLPSQNTMPCIKEESIDKRVESHGAKPAVTAHGIGSVTKTEELLDQAEERAVEEGAEDVGEAI